MIEKTLTNQNYFTYVTLSHISFDKSTITYGSIIMCLHKITNKRGLYKYDEEIS